VLARYRAAIAGLPLPLALVDLDAVDANIERLLSPVRMHMRTRAQGQACGTKTLRLATKSIRCPDLVRYIATRGGPILRGLMTYTATETSSLAEHGDDDLLLAYPTVDAQDLALLAETNARGATHPSSWTTSRISKRSTAPDARAACRSRSSSKSISRTARRSARCTSAFDEARSAAWPTSSRSRSARDRSRTFAFMASWRDRERRLGE
jgi:hypothetical protein